MDRPRWLALACTAVSMAVFASAATPAPSTELPAGVVAAVDGELIGQDEFNLVFTQSARRRFYHGRAPEQKIEELKSEVIDQLILQRLLLREAERRGIRVNTDEIDARLAEFLRGLKSEAERKVFETQVRDLRQRMVENARLGALEEAVRTVEEPDPKTLRDFYQKNRALFLEPARQRVALILIAVKPSDPGDVWREAKRRAEGLVAQLRAGAGFASLAREHSDDKTAPAGGDMGYVHKGMLGAVAQEAIDRLRPGEITDPVQLLQGQAIFRLIERQTERQRALNDVRDRALELYKRATADKRWEDLRSRLRRGADVKIAKSFAAGPHEKRTDE